MISLVTPFDYAILMVGLLASVIFGVVVGLGKALWSSRKNHDD